MKLQIYSFGHLQQRSKCPFLPGTTLISIGDPELDPPVLHFAPEHYLRLSFDDITLEHLQQVLELPPMEEDALEQLLIREYHTFPFTRELARTAAEFLRNHLAHTQVLICQCQFGQSRSAAVAAAVAQYLSGNGQKIFDDPRYSPNPLVYTRLLEALRQA